MRTTAMAAALLALMTSLAPSGVRAQGDAELGRALYEARCGGCHDRSVHQRSARLARTPETLKLQVRRWARETGMDWREDEVDAVTRYLGGRFYRFPCTGESCLPESG